MPRGAGLTVDPAPRRRRVGSIGVIGLALLGGVGVLVHHARRVTQQLPYIQNARGINACRDKLRQVYGMERALFAERDRYAETVYEVESSVLPASYALVLGGEGGELASYGETLSADAVGWLPNLGSPLTPSQVWAAVRVAKERGEPVGLSGTCPTCEHTALCIAQLDGDDALDVWSVSTATRKLHGVTVPPGELSHVVDDLVE